MNVRQHRRIYKKEIFGNKAKAKPFLTETV